MSAELRRGAARSGPTGAFHETRSFCCDCQELHPAALLDEAGAVYLEVACPRGARRELVSRDAAIFRAIRARSQLASPPLTTARGFSWVNFLEITRDCNACCPVCYAGSRPGAGGYLSLEEVVAIAHRLKAQGLKAVSLTGGEPTLHPQLLEMIAAIRRIGLDVTVISNGLRIGEDPQLARRLREGGIAYLYLQHDTLQPEICRRLRGEDLTGVHLRALQHAREAGLHFGINVTVVKDNLDEVGALLGHAALHAPGLGIVTYLSAARTGRFLLEEEARVTREEIIASLIRSGAVEELGQEHFFPFPRFAPLGLDLHPDCGAILLLGVDRGRLCPLDRFLDVGQLFRGLAGAKGGPRVDRRRAGLLLGGHFLRAVRPGQAPALLRMILGAATGRGTSSIITVVVEQFVGELQDQERIDRCTTCSVLRDGERVPMCVFQHPDPRRPQSTRAALAAARGEGPPAR